MFFYFFKDASCETPVFQKYVRQGDSIFVILVKSGLLGKKGVVFQKYLRQGESIFAILVKSGLLGKRGVVFQKYLRQGASILAILVKSGPLEKQVSFFKKVSKSCSSLVDLVSGPARAQRSRHTCILMTWNFLNDLNFSQ